MTKALAFTQASLRRAIAAARAEGLRVTGIRPDGTLLVEDGENAPAIVPGQLERRQNAAPSEEEWGDVEV